MRGEDGRNGSRAELRLRMVREPGIGLAYRLSDVAATTDGSLTVNIERSDHGLTVKLDGIGSLAFFLQTLIRAKFYDDEGVDGLLSPLLNDAIKVTLERMYADQPGAESHYSDWVAHWHLDRVHEVIKGSSEYRSATTPERQEMMRIALYPHQATG